MRDHILEELEDDNRTWALACHLRGLGSLSSVPFAGIIGVGAGLPGLYFEDRLVEL